MAAPIISISSDTESVGSSTSRVVLFGTIPTVIPANASTMVHATPVIHDSAAEIPIIPPRAPKVGVTVVTLPSGIRVALRSSSNTSSSSTVIASPAACQIVPAPPRVPHRHVILVLPGQEIPFGQSYCTQPNGVLRMMTKRKRLHLFPARIPVNRKRFHSLSSSSPPCKRRKTSSCSSSSEGSFSDSSTSLSERSSHSFTTHSPSPSTGPSRKRCRSRATLLTLATHTPRALAPVRADLLPPYKRVGGSSAALILLRRV
uniref:Uncharacterized protein n=1 Tax=Tanacetum cinerariifolium TaxID=118510 RepID=A0A699KK04_TANCI|nr:hypothetical protein [Tanacetum cinerariifolium]